MSAVLPPELRERFECLAELGSGAMGRMLRVRDRSSGAEVALKLLHPLAQGNSRARFEREGRVLARLDHPGILRRLEDGVLADGTPYLVTELLSGSSLEDAPPMDDPLAVLAPVGEALQVAHDAGLLHRDVKPANILHDPGGRTVLIDLGLALAPDLTRLTETGLLVGSLGYMAPELLRGEPATPAADWYAWGVTAYRLAEGELPFSGEVLMNVARGGVLPPPAFRRLAAGSPARRAVEALLVAEADQRPGSWEAVEAVAEGRGPPQPRGSQGRAARTLAVAAIGTSGEGPRAPDPRGPSRSRGRPAALVLLGALGLFLGSKISRGPPGPSRPTPSPAPATSLPPAGPLDEARAGLVAAAAVLDARMPVSPRGPDPAARAARLAPSLLEAVASMEWGRYLDALEDWLEALAPPGRGPGALDVALGAPEVYEAFMAHAIRRPRDFLKAYSIVSKHPQVMEPSDLLSLASRKKEVEALALDWLDSLPRHLAGTTSARAIRWRWLLYCVRGDASRELEIVFEKLLPVACGSPLRTQILDSARHLLSTLRVSYQLDCSSRARRVMQLVRAMEPCWAQLPRGFRRANRKRIRDLHDALACQVPELPDGRSVAGVLESWR